MNLCDYGCGRKAKHQLKNGKWCCSKSQNACPVIIEKIRRSLMGYIRTKEQIKKQREKMIGRPSGHKGKKHSKESKKKTSESLKITLNLPEVKEKMSGKNNSMWKGGISCEPYCEVFKDPEWRQIIYNRDTNNCQLCGISIQLSYKLFGRKLAIHHINHIKKDCDLKNCILICTRCNAIVENKNKIKFYEDYFKIFMEKKEINHVI
jgi:hypothetical protein